MRKVLMLPVFLVMLPVIIFVLAGTPLVLGIVKNKIETAVSDNLRRPVTIGSLRGNLFFVVHARDVEAAGLGRVGDLKVTYNVFGLLARHVDIRSVRIEGVELDVDRLLEVLSDIPKKDDSLPAESSPMKIRIERFSISDGGVGLKLGENPLNVVISAHGMLLHDRLVVENLHIATERSVAVLKGVVPLVKAADLDVVFDVDLEAEDLGVPSLSGGLVSTGTVKGTFSSPHIKASTHVDARIMESGINGFVDLTWVVPYFDSLEVHADLSLATAALQRDTVGYDTLDVRSSLKETRLQVELGSRYGAMEAYGILRGKISQPNFDGRISGRFDYHGFKPSFEGLVRYGDDILRIRQFSLKSRRVSLDLGLRYDLKTKRIRDNELSLHCKDLGVLRSIIDAPEDLSGELWLDGGLSGTVENLAAVALIRLSDVVAFGELITDARFYASMKSNVVHLDSSAIESARGLVTLQGLWDIKKEEFALRLLGDSLDFDVPGVYGADTVMVGATIGLKMIFSGAVHNPQGKGEMTFNDVIYDTLHLGDYSLEFSYADTTLQLGLVDGNNTLTIAAEAFLYGDFPFTATAEIRHFAVDQFISPTVGHVTADLRAKGSLAEIKRTAAAVRIDTVDLTYEDDRLYNVEPVLVDLNEGIVSFDRFTLGIAGQTIHLEGTLPIDLETANMDISGKAANIQLSEIAGFLPGSPPVAGRVNFDVRIQGRPRQLDIDGNLVLDGVNYAIENVSIDSVSGRFLFKNGLVTCESLSGKINRGRFEIGGIADVSHGLLDTVYFKVELNRIDYANKDFGRVLTDAELQAYGRRDSLWIKGEIAVVEGVYDAPMKLQTFVRLLTSANRPEPQQPEIAKHIYCDIGITVPDSIVIANNVADLSVRADLQLKGYLARLNAYGTISAISEGTVKYLGRNFTIVNAVIQFDDPYKIDPVIELTANTTIEAADGDYEIFLRLDGTVTTWQLELNSSPPLPEQDIVSLLLVGQRRVGTAGGLVKELDLKGRVAEYVGNLLRYSIEKTTENALGLDKFTITEDMNEPGKTRIGIEKSIGKGMKLYYSTGLESWELFQVGASYDLNDNISIFSLYDQENRNTGVDLEYRLKIK